MDFTNAAGYFMRRIEVPSGLPATLFALPFKALLKKKARVEKVIEYEEIGANAFKREVLEYPEDPTRPAVVAGG